MIFKKRKDCMFSIENRSKIVFLVYTDFSLYYSIIIFRRQLFLVYTYNIYFFTILCVFEIKNEKNTF